MHASGIRIYLAVKPVIHVIVQRRADGEPYIIRKILRLTMKTRSNGYTEFCGYSDGSCAERERKHAMHHVGALQCDFEHSFFGLGKRYSRFLNERVKRTEAACGQNIISFLSHFC